ncbi:hypothetical protein RB597_008689 [Gaeumannomyces tritici]
MEEIRTGTRLGNGGWRTSFSHPRLTQAAMGRSEQVRRHYSKSQLVGSSAINRPTCHDTTQRTLSILADLDVAMNRQTVLGSSHRVQKQRPREGSTPAARALVSSWTAGFPRREAGEPSANKQAGIAGGADPAAVPAGGDQTPPDIPQAMAHARDNMFSALPKRGIPSALAATVLSRRASLPPMVSAAHLQALLGWTPTTVERGAAELARAGTLRRVAVPGRGAMGEVLVLAADLERMLGEADGLGDAARDAFARMLREHPAAQAVPAGSLAPEHLAALVRAGFLTGGHGGAAAVGASIFARPEDRGTLISLATVARAASGTVGAVGGEGGSREHVLSSSGSAVGAGSGSGCGAEYRIAIPGAGVGLKLVAAALAHLTELLARLPDREAPEDTLRERWDGGGNGGGGRRQAGRGGRFGVAPSRARRWKEFSGLRFDWVLDEAVGAGLVEVFETGCVGRGVRLVSPP